MTENVKTVKPAMQSPLSGATAARLKKESAALFARATPRTMALTAILVCFAASGALRLGDMWSRGDLDGLFAKAPASAESVAASSGAGASAGALEKAEDMESALAAMEAAIAAGDISTASTPAKPEADHGPKGDPYAEKTTPRLPPVGSAKAGQAADLLAALKKREADLDAYAAKLAERNEALTLAAERLETRIQELETSKEQFEVLVATVDQAATRDVAHLIKMYEKMKPKQAAPLFDSMDPGFAAGFLARMKPDAASAIMAKMSTGAAYAVSLQLAGRNVRKTPGAKPAPSSASPAKKKP